MIQWPCRGSGICAFRWGSVPIGTESRGVYRLFNTWRCYCANFLTGGVVLSWSVQKRFDAAVSYIRDILTDSESKLLVELVQDAKHEAEIRLYLVGGAGLIVGFVAGALIF